MVKRESKKFYSKFWKTLKITIQHQNLWISPESDNFPPEMVTYVILCENTPESYEMGLSPTPPPPVLKMSIVS